MKNIRQNLISAKGNKGDEKNDPFKKKLMIATKKTSKKNIAGIFFYLLK